MQLQQELHEKQHEATRLREELGDLKESLRSEKQILEEVKSECNRLSSLYEEKDMALQVSELSIVNLALHMILLEQFISRMN